jgi:hypothetical protein
MKTVIYVWSTKYIRESGYCWEKEHYWGLGDMLRGILAMHYICKKLNYNLIIDYSLHPISNFINQIPHDFNDIIQKNKDNIRFYVFNSYDQIENFLKKEFINNDVTYFATNASLFVYDSIDEAAKKFIKENFTPNDELKKLINSYTPTIENYSIIHYRLGDNFLSEKENAEIFSRIVNQHFIFNYKDDDIFITDSNSFKRFVKENLKNVKIVDIDVGHIGLEKNIDLIKNTLIEFFIMTRAKHIKTYTNYTWISGFVHIVHKIYDVPIFSKCRFSY